MIPVIYQLTNLRGSTDHTSKKLNPIYFPSAIILNDLQTYCRVSAVFYCHFSHSISNKLHFKPLKNSDLTF